MSRREKINLYLELNIMQDIGMFLDSNLILSNCTHKNHYLKNSFLSPDM